MPGASAQRPVLPVSSGGSGNATSIQGKAVAPGGVDADVLALQANVWVPGPANAVQIQGNPVDVTAFSLVGQAYLWDGAKLVPGIPAGGGDIVGPVASTDNAIMRWNGVNGDVAQDSLVGIDDFGNMSLLANGSFQPFTTKINNPVIRTYYLPRLIMGLPILCPCKCFVTNNSPTRNFISFPPKNVCLF